jgi:preprotein translocase subunit SecA
MRDDEALESSMLSSTIERAQKKVEENNFGIRKRLLEYDDVMNYQREAIYSRRRNAISGEKVEIDLSNMMIDTASLIIDQCQGMDFDAFQETLMAKLSIDAGFDSEFYEKSKPDALVSALIKHMQEVYARRMDVLVEKLSPIIKNVYEKQGQMYQNIAIPISDGRKTMTVSVNLEKAYNSEGREVGKTLSKNIILYQIDEHWKQHLRDMDDLKQSVQNASYEQKDPIVVYKLESYNLFAQMLESLNQDVLSFLMRAFVPLRDASEAGRPAMRPRQDMSTLQAGRQDLTTNGEQRPNAPVRAEKKIGRNDPCPCGSGKKYKNCHGKGIV